jgi:hypothetical protein
MKSVLDDDPDVVLAHFLDQGVENRCIAFRQPHAAMRCTAAKALGVTGGVDLHFKQGLGKFLEDCYTSIETFAA